MLRLIVTGLRLGSGGGLGFALALALGLPCSRLGHAEPLRPRPQHMIVAHEYADELPSLGPRHAPVTMDVYISLTDRTWQQVRLYQSMLELSASHPTRLRVIYRLVPWSGQSLFAEVLMEAHADGRFFATMDELIAFTRRTQRMPTRGPEIEEICARAGVPYARVQAAWADGRHLDLLKQNELRRWRRDLGDTPVVLFNGVVTSARGRSLDRKALESNYDIAYAMARRKLEGGVPVEHIYGLSLRELRMNDKLPIVFTGAVDDAASARPIPITAAALLGPQPDAPGFAVGPPEAPATIRFYCSFLSPRCALFKRTLDILRDNYGDELRLVFHHMLPPKLDPASLRDLLQMHAGAVCASEQDAFWDFYDNAYQQLVPRLQRGLLIDEQLDEIVDRTGIARDAFAACMKRPGVAASVEAAVRAAREAGVSKSPTVVIGGRIYEGTTSLGDLRRLIEEEHRPGLLEQVAPTWTQ